MDERRLAALDKSSLFHALDVADRAELASLGHDKEFAAGDPIFYFGDPGHSMIAILVGRVRISLPAPNGKDVILTDLGPGEVFGEIALLDGGGRSAEAVALSRVELLMIDRRDVLEFLTEHPHAGLTLLEHVCRMLRSSDERMSDIAFADVGRRLAKAILRQVRHDQSAAKPPKIAVAQHDLARMIAGSREAVNRQLAAWQKADIVELRSGWIVVLQPLQLEIIAGLGGASD